MSNALWWKYSIQSQGKVYSSSGSAKAAPISPLDIAKLSLSLLTSQEHIGKIYERRELLTGREQVAILGTALGREILFEDVSVESAVRASGAPESFQPALVQEYQRVHDGRAADVRDVSEAITGEAPQTFAAWCVNTVKTSANSNKNCPSEVEVCRVLPPPFSFAAFLAPNKRRPDYPNARLSGGTMRIIRRSTATMATTARPVIGRATPTAIATAQSVW